MNLNLAGSILGSPSQAILVSGWSKIFLEINQSETRIPCGSMFVNGSGRNEHSL
jgi:hypothetical protein